MTEEQETADEGHASASPAPPERAPSLEPSRTAVDLVAAYGVAQWNVVQARFLDVDPDQFREAKRRQVEAYQALMEYIARVEQRAR